MLFHSSRGQGSYKNTTNNTWKYIIQPWIHGTRGTMKNKQRLELTWIGKEKTPRLEPRILLEDMEKSHHAENRVSDNDIFDNKLIFGDNLLALKSLEQDYTGKVKCIYIDPPYNTGSAFEHYDDGIEHSLWLGLMRDRLELLRNLLAEDGVIFIQIDDAELHYLKVLADEIFGRINYLNTITIKAKSSSGASGGGEDKRIKKNTEYILIYKKSDNFYKFKDQYEDIELIDYIDSFKRNNKNFAYNSVLVDLGEKTYFTSTKDGRGEEIKVFKHTNYVLKTVNMLAKEESVTTDKIYQKYFDKIYTLENAQTSIRTRVIDCTGDEDNFYSIEYVPVSGKNKGKLTEVSFIGRTKRLVSYLKHTCVEKRGKPYKRLKMGTLWTDLSWSAVSLEGGVKFPNGKKPEKLIKRIIEMITNPGDLVLDSFAGSGTTGAVAHKMGRRWIMIELGDHCHTHIAPRLQKVIDGTDQGGISKAVNWKGGGGFRYYRLAPSLLERDCRGRLVINDAFNPAMLAEALCKMMGFTYAPSEDYYWEHGYSTESDFIYVTTQTLDQEQLEALSEEVGEQRSLLVCCSAFRAEQDDYSNLTLQKIPNVVLKNCEWGRDDYSLNVQNLPATIYKEKEHNLFGEEL